jgi:seryl-tRNA synthetase
MKNIFLKYIGICSLLIILFSSCFKDDLLKEIDALKDTVSSMQRRNDSLSFFINAKADSLGKALTAAQKRSDSLASVLKTKSDSLSIALGITNSNLSALTKSVDSIKVQVANVNGQLAQLNSQLTSVTTQLTQLNQQFGALGADYAALNAKYQELSATLQALNTQIAALQAEQLKLLERLNAILLQLNPPIDLTTGLVAYYPFSGNAGDSSGNGNHGTVNGATLATDRFGKVNSAYSFASSIRLEYVLYAIRRLVECRQTLESTVRLEYSVAVWHLY